MPCSSYEDIGVFCLAPWVLGPILRPLHTISSSARDRSLKILGSARKFALIVSLILALYLVLKLRHRRPVFAPLGGSGRARFT